MLIQRTKERAQSTDFNSLDFSTVVADSLENLLDLLEKAVVVDWNVQFNDTKMTRAFGLIFFASSALEVSIDGTEMRIVRTFFTRLLTTFVPVIIRLELSLIRGIHFR